MEHYILCVWDEVLCEEDEILVINYLDSLFPTSHQHKYVAHFTSEVAALLKPVSKYIAVLNTSHEYENIEWKDCEDFNIKDSISKEVNSAEYSGFVSKDVEQLSTLLHTLADQLPAFGTYKLDVLIGSNVLKDLSVRKEPVLAGAFFRLVKWHCAFFSIFIQKECDQDRIDEWCEIVNAEILHSNNKLKLGALLWRGAVQFPSLDSQENIVCEGFELKLDLNENEDTIFFHPVNVDTEQKNSKHIVLSSKFQVVDKISLASIPPYMLTPIAFRLHLGKPNIFNEQSLYFTEYLQSNKEVALIMRLGYAEINEKMKLEKKYCTSRWQKAIASGCLKDLECFVSTSNNWITFAVTKSRDSNCVLAYPLKDTKNFSTNFCFSIISYKAFYMSSHMSEEKSVDTKENVLFNVPFTRISDINKIRKKYTVLNMNHCKTGSSQCSAENVPDPSTFWDHVRKSSIYSLSIKTKATNLSFEEVDPSDWPERIQLLCKQMQNEEKGIPESELVGQSLKLPQQSLSVPNEDISQYFLPSGELKNSTAMEVVNPLKMDQFVTHDFDTVLHMNWPEMISCIYHDIYYNSSYQIEDKESLGSDMVKLYIQHETASSCNKQQTIQNFSITLPERNSTPYKEFRSPSCRQANSANQRRSKRLCVTSKEGSIKDLLTKKVLFTSKPSQSQVANKRERSEEEKAIGYVDTRRSRSEPVRCNPRKKIPVNYSGPIRCSPRKKKTVNYKDSIRYSPRKKTPLNSNDSVRCSPRRKNPVNYNNPSGSRKIDTGGDNKSQASDLLRKKIRNAVATALEKNGIGLNHQFYQPCGKRLFAICQTFLEDLSLKKGKTSEYLQKIADAHVKQVIEFFKD